MSQEHVSQRIFDGEFPKNSVQSRQQGRWAQGAGLGGQSSHTGGAEKVQEIRTAGILKEKMHFSEMEAGISQALGRE
ncbi:hypothetical protein RRF57_006986 [Xylaria bambusicola]|uniref:Uncharacterized protein n=1 Tax=Xylaria bambusicola TaxID=326684 RepID=A0AAN7UM31_9PEZI